MVNVSAERAPQTSDVVTEADFVRRRRDRVAPEHDPALFATAYSRPVPSPDGRMLAWISDRDGRPHAFVAPLPPDGSAVAEPAWPLPTDGEPGVPWDVQKIAWSPDGFWLACQLAPGGGERTRVRLVTPDGTQVHDLAPSAPAVTLGSWSPSGRQLGITIFGGGTGDGVASLVDVRDGTLDDAHLRPRGAGLRDQRRRHARRRPRRQARCPSARALRPAQRTVYRAAPRWRGERRGRPLRDHRWPAVRALRRRGRAARAAGRRAQRRRRAVAALRRRGP